MCVWGGGGGGGKGVVGVEMGWGGSGVYFNQILRSKNS